jgi:hypothetical protein
MPAGDGCLDARASAEWATHTALLSTDTVVVPMTTQIASRSRMLTIGCGSMTVPSSQWPLAGGRVDEVALWARQRPRAIASTG